MIDLGEMLSAVAADVEVEIEAAVAALGPDGGERLSEALRYVALNGGKRMRPFFVCAGADLFDVPRSYALRVGAAVEMIHCYSLVHDDLPCMDDDSLRRGRPACHIRYDEACAILVGDALLTMAFAVLADSRTHPDADVRCRLITDLARAAGAPGMVGGQMRDLQAEDTTLTLEEISLLQRLKTGALLRYSCLAGASLGQGREDERKALEGYARDIGLAFQIRDDLLDLLGDEKEIGKSTGKDRRAGKATFVSLLGAEQAREKARSLVRGAIDHLRPFGKKADPLRAMAAYVIERTR